MIISDNQDETWLIITINDTSIGDRPLIIDISDTSKNQPKRIDFDNTINLSNLIVNLESHTLYTLGGAGEGRVQGRGKWRGCMMYSGAEQYTIDTWSRRST